MFALDIIRPFVSAMSYLRASLLFIVLSIFTRCVWANEVKCRPVLGTDIDQGDCVDIVNSARQIAVNAHPRRNMLFYRGSSGVNALPWAYQFGSCAISVDLKGSGLVTARGSWTVHIARLNRIITSCAPDTLQPTGIGGVLEIGGFQYIIQNPLTTGAHLPQCFNHPLIPTEDVLHCQYGPAADALLGNNATQLAQVADPPSSAQAHMPTFWPEAGPSGALQPGALRPGALRPGDLQLGASQSERGQQGSLMDAQPGLSQAQTDREQVPGTTVSPALPRPPPPDPQQTVKIASMNRKSHNTVEIHGSYQLINGQWLIDDSWRIWDGNTFRNPLFSTDRYFLLQGIYLPQPPWPTAAPVPHAGRASLELSGDRYLLGGAWISDGLNWVPQEGVVGERGICGVIRTFRGGTWLKQSGWFLLRGSGSVQKEQKKRPLSPSVTNRSICEQI